MRLGQRRAELIYHQLRKLEKYLLEAFCTQANIDYYNQLNKETHQQVLDQIVFCYQQETRLINLHNSEYSVNFINWLQQKFLTEYAPLQTS